MSLEPTDFREKLFGAQDISPTLRAAYQKEVESIVRPAMTPRRAAPGVFLLLLLVAGSALIARNLLFHRVGALLTAGWIVLVAAFVYAAVLIGKDLWQRKHSLQAQHSIANTLYGAAGIMTVVALLLGMVAPSDPRSTFGAFYVFVFYFACAVWSLENHISAGQLASREQMLRLECRLADLAGRRGNEAVPGRGVEGA